MSKRILFVSVLALASLFVSCETEEETKIDAPVEQALSPKQVPIVKVDAFEPPADKAITVEKAKLYAKASAALVELGVTWSEKIEKSKDNEKVQIVNAYNVARDQLCARLGLAGLAEYNWINDVALPEPKNIPAFEAAGVRKPR
ncbi:MAG: hypothetical protein HUK21_04260 [Fibrobacteraceae bacterium]|nr:hypothetical protein [Fibrobacteraceae bacterium]